MSALLSYISVSKIQLASLELVLPFVKTYHFESLS